MDNVCLAHDWQFTQPWRRVAIIVVCVCVLPQNCCLKGYCHRIINCYMFRIFQVSLILGAQETNWHRMSNANHYSRNLSEDKIFGTLFSIPSRGQFTYDCNLGQDYVEVYSNDPFFSNSFIISPVNN